jgi:hypothetical protein
MTYLVLLAIGLLLGAMDAFLVPQRLFGGVEGLAAVLALVGNTAVGSFGGLATRSMIGAIVPAVGWFVAVGVLMTIAPGGDVVIAGRLPADPGVVDVGMALLVLGIFGAGIALLVTSRYTKRVHAPTSIM